MPTTKTCPFCAEDVLSAAIKCKHCGSDLTRQNPRPRPNKPSLSKPKAKDHPAYTTASLVAFLLPVIGFVVGIVYLVNSDPIARKLGEHAIVASVLGALFWGAALILLGSLL